MDNKYSINVQRDNEKGLISITGVIPHNEVEEIYKATLQKEAEVTEIKGFRKGKAPIDKVESALGENKIFASSAESIVRILYPAVISEKKLDVIGTPELQFTKLARGNDVEFLIKVGFIEDFEVPDYKKIATAEIPADKTPVKDEDVETIIKQIKTGLRDGKDLEKPLSIEELKKVGKYDSVEEFEKKLRSNLSKEKEFQAKQKHRARIAKSLVDKVNINPPKVLIDSRVNMMIDRMKFDARRFGTTFEAYLKQINKTEEALREEIIPKAKESVIFELILDKIANKEKIEADESEIVDKIKKVLEQNPKANESYVKAYLKEESRREKTLQKLETYSLSKN